MERIDAKVPEGWSARDWSNFKALEQAKATERCLNYIREQVGAVARNAHQRKDVDSLGLKIACFSGGVALLTQAPVMLFPIAAWYIGGRISLRQSHSPVKAYKAQVTELGVLINDVGGADRRKFYPWSSPFCSPYCPEPSLSLTWTILSTGKQLDKTTYNCHAALAALIERCVINDGVFQAYVQTELTQAGNIENGRVRAYLKLWCEDGKAARRRRFRDCLLSYHKVRKSEELQKPVEGAFGFEPIQGQGNSSLAEVKSDRHFSFRFSPTQFRQYLARHCDDLNVQQLNLNFLELKKGLKFINHNFVSIDSLVKQGKAEKKRRKLEAAEKLRRSQQEEKRRKQDMLLDRYSGKGKSAA